MHDLRPACEQGATCQGGCKAAAQVCYGSREEMEWFLRESITNNEAEA